MKVIKKRIQKALKKVLKKLDLNKELISLISQHSYITLNKEFKLLPTINLEQEEKDHIENEINKNLNQETKRFKKLYKKVSSKKNKKYQNLFLLSSVDLIIDNTEEGVSLFIDKKHKKTISFLNCKWLEKVMSFKKGALLPFEDFEALYPEIEELKSLGLNVVYKKGKTKAKVTIFPAETETFFSKDDIFSRKVIIDGEVVNPSEFKEVLGNILFYKDKLVELDEDFLKEVKKQETLSYIDVVRESLIDNASLEGKLKEFLDNKIKFKDIQIPEMKNIVLEKYQEEGVKWLVNNALNHFGSVLADDMGLGKTIQTITAIQALKNELGTIKALVVVPTAVLLNWEYEIARFSDLTSSFYYGANKTLSESDVVLTTYGTVTYDNLLKEETWDLIIIDEAQKIKNHDAIISNKINLIPSKSKIALTGTPVENNLMDLWSIFNFIIPGYLGFKLDFKGKYGGRNVSEEDLAELKKVIDPFILRREKSILPLPKKKVKDIMIKLTPEQEMIYNRLVEDSLAELEALKDQPGKRLGLILSTITRLKQVCNHPGNFSKEFEELESAKLQMLRKVVKHVREKKEKMIIFTQYVSMANILAEEFEGSLVFHGGLNVRERVEMLNEFKSDDRDIIIISLKAGGAGLNIVEANHVVHYDLWFNPAVENQATDRAYRRGQKKDVFVYRFISSGTFEEKINNMIVSKKDLFDKTMNGGGLSFLSQMDNDSLRDIFSFGKN